MRVKHLERGKAIIIRKAGETIPAIAARLGVSKGSVSLWIQGIVLPKKAQEMIQSRKVRARAMATQAKRRITSERLTSALDKATLLISRKEIDSELALIMCALLYWCEGTKTNNDREFTFTNSDPLLVRAFLVLLRKSLMIDEKKLRVKMHLHEYHDEKEQKKFWSKITGVPEQQFQATFWKPHTGKTIKDGYPGCIHVRYHDVVTSRMISATARAFLEDVVN